MKKITFIALLALVAVMFSCNRRSVQRIDPDKQIDLSGRWNDTDSKLVAQEMIADVLARPWRTAHVERTGQKTCRYCGRHQKPLNRTYRTRNLHQRP